MSGWFEWEPQLQAGKLQNLGGKVFRLSQYSCNESPQLTRFKYYTEGASGLAKGIRSPCVCTKDKLELSLLLSNLPVQPLCIPSCSNTLQLPNHTAF